MARHHAHLLRLLGLNASGDIGPFTCYKSKRREIIFFAKTWPQKPPSYLQIRVRNWFRQAATAWNALPECSRIRWNRLAKNARLRISGFNLFTYATLSANRPYIDRLAKKYGPDPFSPCT